jgi:hypothetical protein
VTADAGVEDLLRELAPRVLDVLVRRYEDSAVCEDAVQDALVAAAQHWPEDGVPRNPRSWLVTAASRAVVDEWRGGRARRRREEAVAALEPPDKAVPSGQDDSLALLLTCCHPVLPVPSQLALTLRAVGLGQGLTERVGDGISSGVPGGGTDGMRCRGGRCDGAQGARQGGEQPACESQHGESDQQQRGGSYLTRCHAHAESPAWATTIPPTVRPATPAAGSSSARRMLSSPGR